MLSPKGHLTFGEIAKLWPPENADESFGQDREQILDRFLVGLKNHEFDHAELTVKRAAKHVSPDSSWRTFTRVDAYWMPVTLEYLNETLFRFPDKINRKVLLKN